MPRMSVVIDEFRGSPINESIDVCQQCWPRLVAGDPDTVDRIAQGTGVAAELLWETIDELDFAGDRHPPYEGPEYRCAVCNNPLLGRDN